MPGRISHVYKLSVSLMILNLVLINFGHTQTGDRFLRRAVAIWSFEEAKKGGLIEDLTGNGHDALFVNSPELVPGRFGMAMQMSEKTKSFLEVPNAADFNFSEAFTVAAWVKRPIKKPPRDRAPYPILAKGQEWQRIAGANYGVSLHKVFDNMFYFWYKGGFQGVSGVDDGDWHHYTVIVDVRAKPIRLELYIDGVLKPIKHHDGEKKVLLVPNHYDVRIGAFHGESFNSHSDNTIDELAVFHTTLSEVDIKHLMLGFDNAIRSTSPGAKLALLWGTIKQ